MCCFFLFFYGIRQYSNHSLTHATHTHTHTLYSLSDSIKDCTRTKLDEEDSRSLLIQVSIGVDLQRRRRRQRSSTNVLYGKRNTGIVEWGGLLVRMAVFSSYWLSFYPPLYSVLLPSANLQAQTNPITVNCCGGEDHKNMIVMNLAEGDKQKIGFYENATTYLITTDKRK